MIQISPTCSLTHNVGWSRCKSGYTTYIVRDEYLIDVGSYGLNC